MLAASPDEQRGYGDMQPCTGCERHSSSRTADLQLYEYSHSQLKKRPAHVPHGRARSTRQAARPPEFARRAPTGSQQGTGSYVRTYGITARIPSLEVDPPAIGSYGPQKHTFSRFTPFPKFPKHWLSNSHFEGDCVKVLTIQLAVAPI